MRSSKTRKNILKPKYTLVLKTKSKLWFNPNKIRKLKKKRKWRATYFPLKFTHYKRNSFTLAQKKIKKSLLQYYNTNRNLLPTIYEKYNFALKNINNKLAIDSISFKNDLNGNKGLNPLLTSFKKLLITKNTRSSEHTAARSSFIHINNKIRKLFFDQFNCFNSSKINNDLKYFLKKYLKYIEILNQYKGFSKNYYEFKRYFFDKKFLILNRSDKLNFFVKSKTDYDIHTIHGKYSSIFLNDFKINLYKLKTFKLFYGMINRKSIKRLLQKSYVKGKRAKLQLFLTKFFELKLDVLIYRLQWSKSTLHSRFVLKRNDILVNNLKTNFKKTFLNPGDLVKITKDKNYVMYQHLYSSFSNYTKIHPKYKSTPREYVTLWHLFLSNLRNKNKMIIGRFPKRVTNVSLWNNFKYNVSRIPELRRSFAHNFKISKIDTKKPFFFVSQRFKEYNKIFNQRIFKSLNNYLKLKKLPKSSVLKSFKQRINFIDKKSNFKLNLFFINFNRTHRPFSYIKHMSNYRQRMIFFNFLQKKQKDYTINNLAEEEDNYDIYNFLVKNTLESPMKFHTHTKLDNNLDKHKNISDSIENSYTAPSLVNLEDSLVFKLYQNYQKFLIEKNHRTGMYINGGFVLNLENLEKNFIFGGLHRFFLNNVILSNKNALFLKNLKRQTKNKIQDPEKLYNDTIMRKVNFKNSFFRVGFNQIIKVKWRNYLKSREKLIFVENNQMLIKKNSFLHLQKNFFDKKQIFLFKSYFNRLKKIYSLKLADFLEANLHNYLKTTPELTPEIGLLFAQALEDRLDGKISAELPVANINKKRKINVEKHTNTKNFGIYTQKRNPRISRNMIKQHILLEVKRSCLQHTENTSKLGENNAPDRRPIVNLEDQDHDNLLAMDQDANMTLKIEGGLGELQKEFMHQLNKDSVNKKTATSFEELVTLSYKSLLLNDLNASYQINNFNSSTNELKYLQKLFDNKLIRNRARLLNYKKTCISLLNPSYLEASSHLAVVAEYPNPQQNFSEHNSFFLNKNNLFLLLK